MPRNEELRIVEIKLLLSKMAELGIIRITMDPIEPLFSSQHVEIWSRTNRGRGDRVLESLILTREEKEFYASEYDKCFGTAPRSDENGS